MPTRLLKAVAMCVRNGRGLTIVIVAYEMLMFKVFRAKIWSVENMIWWVYLVLIIDDPPEYVF